MKAKPILTFIAGTTMMVLSSCQKSAPRILQETKNPYMPKKTIEMLDSMAKEGIKIVNNPEYECIKQDTISCDNMWIRNFYDISPERLEGYLHRKAESAIPETKIAPKYKEVWSVDEKTIAAHVDEYVPNYVDPQVVVENKFFVYSPRPGENPSFPVSYWAKPNPELQHVLDSVNSVSQNGRTGAAKLK